MNWGATVTGVGALMFLLYVAQRGTLRRYLDLMGL